MTTIDKEDVPLSGKAVGSELRRFALLGLRATPLEWARLAIEALTLIVIFGGVWAAFSTLESINESVREAGRSADAAEKAANAAIAAASATERQVELAGQQMEIAKQQIGDARDALRLDQRAWLGYEHYVIQARANNTSGWEAREPRAGEQFSGRLYIQNVGKTPARNVRFMSVPPILTRVGEIPAEPEEEEWSKAYGASVVFPNDDGLSQSTRVFLMPDQKFSMYSSRSIEAFFWAKLSYCDTTGRRHWTQTGVVHRFEDREFLIAASSVSPDPGESNHPDCQN